MITCIQGDTDTRKGWEAVTVGTDSSRLGINHQLSLLSWYPEATTHWSCKSKRSQLHGKQPSIHLLRRLCTLFLCRHFLLSSRGAQALLPASHLQMSPVPHWPTLPCPTWHQLVPMMWSSGSGGTRSSRGDIWGIRKWLGVNLQDWGDGLAAPEERGSSSVIVWKRDTARESGCMTSFLLLTFLKDKY